MSITNTTHPIKAITIALAATPVNIGDALGLDDTTAAKSPQCAFFSFQNKDAAASCYLQETQAAAAADSIEVLPKDYYRENYSPDVSYDLREYWLRAGVDGQKVVLQYKRK